MGAVIVAEMPDTLDAFADYLADSGSTGAELLLVTAHPDDETVGFGGQLQRLKQTAILCLTDGAPADLGDARAHGFLTATDYAAARRAELDDALAEIGLPPGNATSLDIPDQQAPLRLVPLTHQLAEHFEMSRPHFVLTHPFEGGHPDHDAASFAVAAACALLRRAGGPTPSIIEMAFYHAGSGGPRYQHFLSAETPEIQVQLTPAAAAGKRRMLDRHATQRETLAAFGSQIERFRSAPRYDFCVLPNAGRLQYEAWGLGLTGADWLRLSAAALDELGLERCP